MKIVAFAPIKLNSERIPNKNLKKIGHYPLCYYVLKTLSSIKLINSTYVFCSDEKIVKSIPKNIIFLKRSSYLDRPQAKSLEIISEFVKKVNADIYILAHVTSPFLKKESIESGLKKVLLGNFDSAFSVEKIKTFTWFKNKSLNYSLNDVPRTQEIEPIFKETSAFYIFKKEVFTELKRRIGKRPYFQETNGAENIDIDEPKDFEFAKNIAKINKRWKNLY